MTARCWRKCCRGSGTSSRWRSRLRELEHRFAEETGPEAERLLTATERFNTAMRNWADTQPSPKLAASLADWGSPRPTWIVRSPSPVVGECGPRWGGSCTEAADGAGRANQPLRYRFGRLVGRSLGAVAGGDPVRIHDRDFIDAVAERVIEIIGGTSHEYVGGLASFVVQREERMATIRATAADQGEARS